VNKLVMFSPRREVDAELNMQKFISLCRDELTVFGADLAFDEDAWDVTDAILLKAKGGRLRAVFSSWATVNEASPSPMAEPFLSFAKAYFRYQHSMRPTKVIGSRIAAMRALCAALEEHGTAVPTRVDVGTLNRASQLVAEGFSKDVAYRVGGQLEMLATFMDDNHLAALPLHWRNHLKRPSTDTGRVGKEFDARRDRMLPSAYALDSLARAFRAASESLDVVVTSAAALLCSSPDRVNEVLGLRAECEYSDRKPDGTTEYGLRFWPSKGAAPMLKRPVTLMRVVVEEALERLRDHTKEAREVAAWYEANQTSLFLPTHLSHLRKNLKITIAEVTDVLFATPPEKTTVRAWCKDNGVSIEKVDGEWYVEFADLERAVVAKLPKNFPFADVETGLRYSEALFIVRRNELHETKTTYRCIFDLVGQGVIATGLGNRSEFGFRSVFDRLGLFEPDGAPIIIRSHQFRHYLNTLAQAGGMSELDIAKWSGRKEIGQNSAYNQVSDRDVQARMKELVGDEGQSFGALVVQTRVNLVPRAKFAEMKIQAAHTTDFGFCAHDYAMSPCQLHLDCINCNDQVCLKGDECGEANVRSKYEETRVLLLEAEAAEADMAYGATHWVKHQQMALERLAQLIQIFDDRRVAIGAVIRLSHIKPASRIEQAVNARKSVGLQADPPRLIWRVVEQEVLA
jgi:hypothetical protein